MSRRNAVPMPLRIQWCALYQLSVATVTQFQIRLLSNKRLIKENFQADETGANSDGSPPENSYYGILVPKISFDRLLFVESLRLMLRTPSDLHHRFYSSADHNSEHPTRMYRLFVRTGVRKSCSTVQFKYRIKTVELNTGRTWLSGHRFTFNSKRKRSISIRSRVLKTNRFYAIKCNVQKYSNIIKVSEIS